MTTLVDILRQIAADLRQRPWIGGGLAAWVLAALLILWVVVPRGTQAWGTYADWTHRTEQVERAADAGQRIQAIERETKRLGSGLDSLYVRVPRGDKISVVLDSMQTFAVQSGVTLYSIRPEPMRSGNVYAERPLALRLRGGFHPIARFVDRVERMAYLVSVDRLEITPAERDASRRQDEPLVADLNVSIITLRSDS